MSNMTVQNVNYNALSGMFEARVDVRSAGVTYRYPCAVAGPLTMCPDQARSRLMQQAERMSDTGGNLRSVW